MEAKEFERLARRLMSCPAAPFYEGGVRREVELICAEHGLGFERDEFGNVIVRSGRVAGSRALVLAAHMDHPGFEILRAAGRGLYVARFNGGVPDSFFRPGISLRLMPGSIAARLGRRLAEPKQFEIRAAAMGQAARERPRFAVWEVEDFRVQAGRIHGRACDDLIGVAAILATLLELKRRRCRAGVIGVISRAEEVGFQGALAVAAGRLLPARSLIISLETSKELAPVKMGQGCILRVGDRTSIFDSEAMRFLGEAAALVQARDPRRRYQRALMSGGTCEATAYQAHGFQTAAVCVALGNYHNCGPAGRIAAEYVSLADACGMVDLLVEAAVAFRSYSSLTARLPARLGMLLRQGRRNLRRHAG